MTTIRGDDSLASVLNINDGSKRATTPQFKRNSTPQRSGSAPRSSSAPKSSRIAQAFADSRTSNRRISASTSRRKRQKWENDNLFGLQMLLRKKQTSEDSAVFDEFESDQQSSGPDLNWNSMFSVILAEENTGALQAYLACSHSFDTRTKPRSRSLRDCFGEWDRAMFAWGMVEKRLRSVVIRTMSNVETQTFVIALEDLLLEMEHLDTLSSPPSSIDVPDSVKHLFVGKAKYSRPRSINGGQSSLVVSLVDSAFHRLILHAVCQFHCHHSKVRNTRIPPCFYNRCAFYTEFQ